MHALGEGWWHLKATQEDSLLVDRGKLTKPSLKREKKKRKLRGTRATMTTKAKRTISKIVVYSPLKRQKCQ